MLATTCPSRDTLFRYSVGLISEEQSDELADHLGSCPDCQATILTLADADDTLIRRLRMPLGSESYLAEPQFQAAVANTIARPDWGAAEQSASDAEDKLAAMPKTLGEYQLLEELGRGGMGRVYKALQTKLDRVVAVKVLPRDRVGNRQAINRFEREMKAVGRLAHPNIVQAYDAREIDDMPVLIMEFVDGLDLADIVRRVGTVPVAEACEMVRRTALALQCAHEHGLVHRDIKPSNIMLTPAGEVKLLDLGLARLYAEGNAGVSPMSASDEMTGTGQAMGTADYMAPEQASDSRTVDIRADIYSLGCTLYKLLSGRAPFSGPEYRSTLDKLNAHVHQPVPPVRNFASEVPPDLAAILDRMLAKDPGERFATPAEVAPALEPFCKGANLAGLTAQAMAIESRPSHGEGESEGQVPLDERALERDSSPRFQHPILRRILIGLGFLGAMAAAFAAGIVITIKINGEKYQVKPPANSQTDIDNKGNVNVSIPGEPERARPSTTNASVEAKALQGQWRVVRVEKGENADAMLTGWVGFDGSHESPTSLGYGYLEFSYGVLRIRDYTRIQDSFYPYKIDPIPATKTIDLTVPPSGAEGRSTMLGIYEIDGDHLKLRLARRLAEVKSEQRPTQFALERGSGDILILLDRYHPSDDEKAIQGQWKVIGRTEDGKPASAESLQYLKGSCGDEGFVIGSYTPGMTHTVLWGPYVLDAAKNPRTITIHDNIVRRREDGQIMESKDELLGIYKFENDRFYVAYRPGGPRPEKFESTPGSGVTLLLLERPKVQAETGGMQAPGAQVVATSPAPQSANSTGQSEATTLLAFRTTTVTRGGITATIGASGTIEPEEVVDVGAQVTGTVVSLGADPRGKSDSSYKDKTIDYGSPVEQNMVLAQIDDSSYRARADQQLAALARAKAELAAAQAKAKGETSEAAKTAVVVAEAAVAQAQAASKETEINLAKTIVKSPISGVIVDRRVNVGQNVGPTPNSAGLFLIAKTLEKMQVWASVNEADIGRIRKGMEARLTVDAFPKDVFKGTVTQIRLNATLTQNVVTYTVVVDIEKPDRKLLPYMTANLLFQVSKRENALRVANAALRWKPTPEQVAPDIHPATSSHGSLWKIDSDGKHVRPVDVQIGLTDGTMTEVSGPDVKEGMEVIVGQTLGSEPNLPQPKPATSPFFRPYGTAASPEPNMPQPRPDASLKAARQVRKEFRQETWDGFWLTAVEERPVNVVAKELAKDCGAVCTARSRVMQRIREKVTEYEQETSAGACQILPAGAYKLLGDSTMNNKPHPRLRGGV